MKIISLFKFFILPFSLILFLSSNTSALTLEKTPISLNAAWGMTWLDDTQMLITQKSGEIFLVDTVDHTQIEISHNIPVVQYGQGVYWILSMKAISYGLLAPSKKMINTPLLFSNPP